jgi:hypothetical protein
MNAMSIGKLRFTFTASIVASGRLVLVAIGLVLLLAPARVGAQTTVFTDDFNRNENPLGNGGTPTMVWTKVSTAQGYSRTEGTSPNFRLAIYNGATSTANATNKGRSLVHGRLSTFLSPYSTNLSSNKDDVVWTMNIRTGRTSGDNGFDASDNYYGYAVVLCATESDFLTANGYAVTLRKGETLNAVRLERINGGLTANYNLATVIGPSVDITSNHYFSVRVVYTPLTNKWKLFARNDGANPADPTSGTLTQVGSEVVDDTYTSTPMTHCGFFVNHQSLTWNSGNNKGNFDNFKVVVDNRVFTPVDNGDWSSAENWGQGTLIPGLNYDVQIPYNRKVTNTGTAACKRLDLESASPTVGSQLINAGTSLSVADKIRVKVNLSDANAWRFVGFPYPITAVYKSDGATPAIVGEDYEIATYNAQTRANGQTGWEAVTEVSALNPLVAGKGYIVASASDLYFETASGPATTAFAASNDASLSFTTGTGSAGHHGWNFIVSPVTANSYLSLDEGQFRYVYNGTTYQVDDTSDGTLTEYPFRAFFIKTTVAGDKSFTTSNPNPNPVPALNPTNNIPKATFYLNDGNGEYSTKIRINELATEAYDPQYDAEQLFPFSNTIPQIYTRLDGKNLAINSVPAGTTIPVYLRIPTAGSFTLRWNLQSDEAMSLYDAATNTSVPLEEATEYNFTVTEPGTITNRFSIRTTTDVTTAQTSLIGKSIELRMEGKLLHINGIEGKANLQLYDIAGRELVNRVISDGVEQVLPHTGLYIVRISSEECAKEFKLVVR